MKRAFLLCMLLAVAPLSGFSQETASASLSSGRGVADALAGKADMGMASRELIVGYDFVPY